MQIAIRLLIIAIVLDSLYDVFKLKYDYVNYMGDKTLKSMGELYSLFRCTLSSILATQVTGVAFGAIHFLDLLLSSGGSRGGSVPPPRFYISYENKIIWSYFS